MQKGAGDKKSLRRRNRESGDDEDAAASPPERKGGPAVSPTPGSGQSMKRSTSMGDGLKRQQLADVAGEASGLTKGRGHSERAFIGLLDMFGFEVFEHNGLEQLCINFANEKLQQYFVRCVFKAEEDIHRLEGVPWPEDVAYHDNQVRPRPPPPTRDSRTPSSPSQPPSPHRPLPRPSAQGCIDSLTRPTTGVFRLLDESCGLKSATEGEWFRRVDQHHVRAPGCR